MKQREEPAEEGELDSQHLRAIFEDHPCLYKYMQLNDQENISTVEDLVKYHNSGRYRPSESQEDLLLMTSLMIILNAQKAS